MANIDRKKEIVTQVQIRSTTLVVQKAANNHSIFRLKFYGKMLSDFALEEIFGNEFDSFSFLAKKELTARSAKKEWKRL